MREARACAYALLDKWTMLVVDQAEDVCCRVELDKLPQAAAIPTVFAGRFTKGICDCQQKDSSMNGVSRSPSSYTSFATRPPS